MEDLSIGLSKRALLGGGLQSTGMAGVNIELRSENGFETWSRLTIDISRWEQKIQ